VEFFKSHRIIREEMSPELVFESSGTTLSSPSRHHVSDLALYRDSFNRGFRLFYGSPGERCILALLPSYLERDTSSLVYMMDQLIGQSQVSDSGFYLDNLEELSHILQKRNDDGIPTLLLGVSFALLDLAEAHPQSLQNVIIMETGGMKGRREEITRSELHAQLKTAFQQQTIHSEYGMTELFSQAYSPGNGLFYPTPTMKVLSREITDPLQLQAYERTGALNIIDLANLDTISFIATEDLGKVYADGGFEILGRLDASDVRGCNLMVL
jgi:hypothetical protein